MNFITPNILAVIVVALIPLVLSVFWSIFSGRKKVIRTIIVSYVGGLLSAYVLSVFIVYFVIATIIPALILGGLVWIGFVVPVLLQKGGRTISYALYFLLSVLLMSVSLALWI
tara:strand:- start:223 stop:561 length:339 start_codon:yes stop_codon:yes gene_type:complete